MPRPRVMDLRVPVGEGRDAVPGGFFLLVVGLGRGGCWGIGTVCEDGRVG